jgi:hypothetical protein
MRHDKVGWLRSAFAKAIAAISFMLLWGCASGPNLGSMESLLKPPQVGQGRIYIYRESAFGAAVQPQVFLNGEPVGRATPGGVYLIDRPPGRYSVSVQTEVENTASFELAAGQAQYVRLDISMGLLAARVKPVVVDPQAGASEAGKLSLLDSRAATPVGSPTSQPSHALRKTPLPTLSRTKIEGMMRERWYLTRHEDGDRLMWEFFGSRVYGTNLTTPGRISGDWRFNDRGNLCFYWDTKRVADRCVFFADQGGRLVLLDASTEAVVHTLERPIKMPGTSSRG